ncbi:dihydrofolate reductase family protein [Streptomyces sanyensis]|uniref:dihydrofolate reductase family protein n=1 Tax=Streptomyces sanyensis TaxID=568869 RepID=UPI003D778800
MGKIVLMMSVSLDGFMETEDRDIGWGRVDEELHSDLNQVVRGMRGLLSGRVTHELMARYWPTADADPGASPAVAEFAGIWRSLPKTVYSRTLRSAEWNTTVVHEVVPEEVAALRDAAPGDLALGGADLADTFLRHDLVDEFRILVHPVLLGRGRPLFRSPREERRDLDLVATRTYGNGVVLLHHARRR